MCHRLSWSGGWRVRLWTDRSAVPICLLPEHFDFLMVHDWVNKGLGMSSHGCATGHIEDPLIEKSMASCPGGRFPPSFIYQVIIISGLNKLYDCMLSPRRWPQMLTGRKSSTQTQTLGCMLQFLLYLPCVVNKGASFVYVQCGGNVRGRSSG